MSHPFGSIPWKHYIKGRKPLTNCSLNQFLGKVYVKVKSDSGLQTHSSKEGLDNLKTNIRNSKDCLQRDSVSSPDYELV